MRRYASAYWILFASLMFATMSALVKLTAAGVSLPEIVFFRMMPAAIVLFLLGRARGVSMATQHWMLHGARCLFGFVGMMAGFYAVSKLPLATSTTLEYTTPLFMLAYIVLFARVHLTPSMVFAMVGGFAGVVILLRPTLDVGQGLPFFSALCSGLMGAIVYAVIRRLGDASEPATRIVFWYSLTSAVAAAAMIAFGSTSNYELSTWFALGGLGTVSLIGQLAMTRAFSTGPTTFLASLQYITVAFAAVYGVLIWGDTLTLTSVIGLSLIVFSGIVALRGTATRVETKKAA